MPFLRYLLLFLIIHFSVEASPTDLFWTNCTTEVLETGKGHFDMNNYTTLFHRRGHNSILNPDFGFLYGLFTWEEISSEVGIDYIFGTDYPIYFNTKLGVKENFFFEHSPSFSVGMYAIGTRATGNERTNYNVVDLVFGKSFEESIGGTIFLGVYSGSSALGKNQKGFMAGYQASFCKATFCDDREYFKWQFIGDYASGNNIQGGGGVSILYYFTPDISIQTGPTWFNSAEQNGAWKWCIQIDIDFTVVQ